MFVSHDGEPCQHVIPSAEASVPVTVTTARYAEITDLVDAAARHQFDLAGELPIRARLFRLTEQEHVLLLLCHHIASDGWSMEILMADLAAAYQARRDGRAPGWAPLPVQYADYALWQQHLLGGDGLLAGQIEYWKRTLAGLPEELALPFDRPRPAEPSGQGAQVRWQLADPALHAALAGAGPRASGQHLHGAACRAGHAAVPDGRRDGHPGGRPGGGADRRGGA